MTPTTTQPIYQTELQSQTTKPNAQINHDTLNHTTTLPNQITTTTTIHIFTTKIHNQSTTPNIPTLHNRNYQTAKQINLQHQTYQTTFQHRHLPN